MKTIVPMVFAILSFWSAATAQILPYYSNAETGVSLDEEAPAMETLNELSSPTRENNNAWFPGLKSYVCANVRYPSAARESGLEGVVHAEATVKVDGKLTDIRIVEGLSYGCDKEVLRLLSGMPAWNPARRNGKPIEQKVFVRVRFQLKPF